MGFVQHSEGCEEGGGRGGGRVGTGSYRLVCMCVCKCHLLLIPHSDKHIERRYLMSGYAYVMKWK